MKIYITLAAGLLLAPFAHAHDCPEPSHPAVAPGIWWMPVKAVDFGLLEAAGGVLVVKGKQISNFEQSPNILAEEVQRMTVPLSELVADSVYQVPSSVFEGLDSEYNDANFYLSGATLKRWGAKQ